MATNPQHVITDNPNVVAVSRDLAFEAAACLDAIFTARREKTLENQRRNVEIKALEKRGKELVDEIRNGGGQLAINFGSTVLTTRALAQTAPKDDEEPEGVGDSLDDDDLPQDEPSEPSETELADENEALQ